MVPLSLVLAALVVWALLWAVRSGQFEDLEGAAHRILLDDEDRPGDAPESLARGASHRRSRREPLLDGHDAPNADDAGLASPDKGPRSNPGATSTRTHR